MVGECRPLNRQRRRRGCFQRQYNSCSSQPKFSWPCIAFSGSGGHGCHFDRERNGKSALDLSPAEGKAGVSPNYDSDSSAISLRSHRAGQRGPIVETFRTAIHGL